MQINVNKTQIEWISRTTNYISLYFSDAMRMISLLKNIS